MEKPKSKPKNRGFSLLEVIVAVAVLAVGIMTVLQAFSFCARIAGSIYDNTAARLLAKDKLQELESKASGQALASLPKTSSQDNRFSWSQEISPYTREQLLQRLDFNLSWRRKKDERQITVNTLLIK